MPSGKAVTTDESAINGCLENLQEKMQLVSAGTYRVGYVCFYS